MIKEAIILAGGLGTRLRSVVADQPKCMAPVNGIPFINFIISYLKNEGVDHFIFSLGYKSEIITEYISNTFGNIHVDFVIEDRPLGTGGAVKLAAGRAMKEDVLILNGDTIFNIDLRDFTGFHKDKKADFTVALKEMKDFNRYGSVEIDADLVIKAFHEKAHCEKGFINGGVYALNIPGFLKHDLPEAFSFEKDFLEKHIGTKKFYGLPCDYYFIDIGVPEDYKRFVEDYNFILSKNKYTKNKITDFIGESFFEGLISLLKT